VVTYDGSLSTAGGSRVETRRFTATAPADGTAATVGPALNRAANQVALDIAKWIGG
jgi:cholesterol transport system auxiliary component